MVWKGRSDVSRVRGGWLARGCSLLLTALFVAVAASGASAQTDNESCFDCHDDPEAEADDGRSVAVIQKRFSAGVHGDFDCVECHTQPGDYEDVPHFERYVSVQCSECHDDVEEEYETSVHHLGGRKKGNGGAKCVSCHSSPHYVVEDDDTASTVHRSKIPRLCGTCHTDETVMTDDYVHLPIALPSYYASVHGYAWKEGNEDAAVCTDCHSAHAARIAQDPQSLVNYRNIAETCGQCHDEVTAEYNRSIHGKAAALGIMDAPTCTTCHDEHVVKKDVGSRNKGGPSQIANKMCGDCHTNPLMLSKYGITEDVVASYQDSYHAWAVDRGSRIAATCIDCHNMHEIRSTQDPQSSVHADNVVATCSQCHEGVTQAFASSYTHAGALDARAVHGWVRLIYIALIVVVLGGMAIHNFIVARYEFRRHLERRRAEPYVQRWMRAERVQHLALLIAFFGLAITGFALRYADQWWVQVIGLGGNEVFRANLHRAFGIMLIATALYHIAWVSIARRGRVTVRAYVPRFTDVLQFGQNMAFHLGRRKTRPAFGTFDYTQKAEYWAVVWGTWVMAVTGLVLWYPTIATRLAPPWIVRVSEVVHFYEAILAVSAIFIWHFFYVIFMPNEYPMSTIWIDGRMSAEEWKELHRAEFDAAGTTAVRAPTETAGETPDRGDKPTPGGNEDSSAP